MSPGTSSRPSLLDEDALHENILKANEYQFDRDDSLHGSFHGGRRRSDAAMSAVAKIRAAMASRRDYKKGEAETIRNVLDEIDLISVKRMSEGFSNFNFSVGVFNCVSGNDDALDGGASKNENNCVALGARPQIASISRDISFLLHLSSSSLCTCSGHIRSTSG